MPLSKEDFSMTDLMKKSTLSAQSAVRGSRQKELLVKISLQQRKGECWAAKTKTKLPILPKQTCSFAVAANLLDKDLRQYNLFRAKKSETK